MKRRYKNLNKESSDFEFLTGEKLRSMNTSDLSKAATDLPVTYSEILSHIEIPTDGFKKHATLMLCNIKSALCLDLLKLIHKFCLVELYPNLGIVLKNFLAILVMVASCNRSLSKLQLFKNYLRMSLGQEKLSNIQSINRK